MSSTIAETVVGSDCEELDARSIVRGDPLVGALWSLDDWRVQAVSRVHDVPSGPYRIPFGLTRVTVPQVPAIDLDE